MWYQNVKGNLLSQQFTEAHLRLPTSKDDIKSYADENYHKTLAMKIVKSEYKSIKRLLS